MDGFSIIQIVRFREWKRECVEVEGEGIGVDGCVVRERDDKLSLKTRELSRVLEYGGTSERIGSRLYK